MAEDKMRIGEAAKYLGVSVKTLQRWDADGRLKAHRTTGNQRYYERDELEQFKNAVEFQQNDVSEFFYRIANGFALNFPNGGIYDQAIKSARNIGIDLLLQVHTCSMKSVNSFSYLKIPLKSYEKEKSKAREAVFAALLLYAASGKNLKYLSGLENENIKSRMSENNPTMNRYDDEIIDKLACFVKNWVPYGGVYVENNRHSIQAFLHGNLSGESKMDNCIILDRIKLIRNFDNGNRVGTEVFAYIISRIC